MKFLSKKETGTQESKPDQPEAIKTSAQKEGLMKKLVALFGGGSQATFNSRLLKLLGVAIFTAFFPLTVTLYHQPDYLSALDREAIETQQALSGDRVLASKVELFEQRLLKSAPYCIPVGILCGITFLGFTFFFFGKEFKLGTRPNFLLLGPKNNYESEDPQEAVRYQQISMSAVMIGFLGAYVWGAKNIFDRFEALDLNPDVYFNLSVRLLVVVVVALVIRHMFGSLKGRVAYILPILAFAVGMTPERSLVYVEDVVTTTFRGLERAFTPTKSLKTYDTSLDMIDGMNTSQKMRMRDAGILNSQNLAQVDIFKIFNATPFRFKSLMDWKGQALLFVYFKEDLEHLRAYSIRTVFDMVALEADKERLKTIANETKIPLIAIENFLMRTHIDPTILELKKIHKLLYPSPSVT